MLLQALAFYVFAAITVASAAMVVVSRNPVYSVLFLILAFFNAAALFLLNGKEETDHGNRLLAAAELAPA